MPRRGEVPAEDLRPLVPIYHVDGPWLGISEPEWLDRITLGAQRLGGWPTWPRPLIGPDEMRPSAHDDSSRRLPAESDEERR